MTSGVASIAILAGADALAAQFADDSARSQELARLLRIGALFVPFFAVTQVLRYCTRVIDELGNRVYVDKQAMSLRGFPTAFEQTAKGDVKPPRLGVLHPAPGKSVSGQDPPASL
jgi:Na+-driven multidrug efflux pump